MIHKNIYIFFTIIIQFTFILHHSVPSPLNTLMISVFYETLPQKYTMGSDWFAGPVCCNFLNLLVHV